MSAQPHEEQRSPAIPNTVTGIRAALPAEQHAAFDEEWREVADSSDLTVVGAFKDRWWCRAAWANSPDVDGVFAALDRGEVELFASPFAER